MMNIIDFLKPNNEDCISVNINDDCEMYALKVVKIDDFALTAVRTAFDNDIQARQEVNITVKSANNYIRTFDIDRSGYEIYFTSSGICYDWFISDGENIAPIESGRNYSSDELELCLSDLRKAYEKLGIEL